MRFGYFLLSFCLTNFMGLGHGASEFREGGGLTRLSSKGRPPAFPKQKGANPPLSPSKEGEGKSDGPPSPKALGHEVAVSPLRPSHEEGGGQSPEGSSRGSPSLKNGGDEAEDEELSDTFLSDLSDLSDSDLDTEEVRGSPTLSVYSRISTPSPSSSLGSISPSSQCSGYEGRDERRSPTHGKGLSPISEESGSEDDGTPASSPRSVEDWLLRQQQEAQHERHQAKRRRARGSDD